MDTELSGNECIENHGGAIWCGNSDCDMLIENSNIKNNVADGDGGGFYNQNYNGDKLISFRSEYCGWKKEA